MGQPTTGLIYHNFVTKWFFVSVDSNKKLVVDDCAKVGDMVVLPFLLLVAIAFAIDLLSILSLILLMRLHFGVRSMLCMRVTITIFYACLLSG